MLLDGKKLLITGVLTDDSIAFAVARVAQESVSVALQTSAYSLKALTVGLLDPLKAAGADGGAAVVSLTFDARFAWPIYDWMGVAKAGLEATTRYLARDLGQHNIRV